MSTPSPYIFVPPVSASAGVTLGDSVRVDVQVMPQANEDIVCEMDCNGKKVRVIYRAAGDVDFDTYPFNP